MIGIFKPQVNDGISTKFVILTVGYSAIGFVERLSTELKTGRQPQQMIGGIHEALAADEVGCEWCDAVDLVVIVVVFFGL